MKNVGLINPPNPENYTPHKPHGDLVYLGGIGYLEASLRGKGMQTTIADAKYAKLSLEEIATQVGDSEIVGISSHWGTIDFVEKMSKLLKERGKTVVVGGTLPSSYGLSEENYFMNQIKDIDYCVVGEGENTFPLLLNAIYDSTKIPDGVISRTGDRIRAYGNGSHIVRDLSTLPAIDFSKFQGFLDSLNGKTLGIQTARGCYANCAFCFKLAGEPLVRAFPLETFKRDIWEILSRSTPRLAMFYDETFTADKQHATEVAGFMKDVGLRYTILARANDMDKELVKTLKQTGCVEAMIGVESFDSGIRKNMRKGISDGDIDTAVSNCADINLPLAGFFIAGYYGETRDTLRRTVEQIKRHKTLIPRMRPFMPLPGTEAYQTALGDGVFSEAEIFERLKGGYVDAIFEKDLLVNLSDVSDDELIRTCKEVNKIGESRMVYND